MTASNGPSPMPVRALGLVATSRLERVAACVQAQLQAWCADWGVDTAGCGARAMRAWEREDAQAWAWQAVVPGAWLTLPAHFAAQVRATLWHEAVPDDDSLAHIAARDAVADFQARWPGLLGSPARVTPGAASAGPGQVAGSPATHNAAASPGASMAAATRAACFAWASGAVLVEIDVAGAMVHLLLADIASLAPPPAAVQRSPRPVAVAQAISAIPVTLQVELGRAQVALGQWLTLAEGDVVRLDRAIDLPARVMAPGGWHVFDGYLGTRDGAIALELHPGQR